MKTTENDGVEKEEIKTISIYRSRHENVLKTTRSTIISESIEWGAEIWNAEFDSVISLKMSAYMMKEQQQQLSQGEVIILHFLE